MYSLTLGPRLPLYAILKRGSRCYEAVAAVYAFDDRAWYCLSASRDRVVEVDVGGWRLADSDEVDGQGLRVRPSNGSSSGGRRATPYSVSAGSGGGDSEKGCAEKKQFGS